MWAPRNLTKIFGLRACRDVSETAGAASYVAQQPAICLQSLGNRALNSRIRMVAKMTIKDIGPKPQSFDIDHATKQNANYRSVAWSGRYLQVTLMSIPVGGDIGLEAHPETDQFLRLDAGSGRVQMGAAKDKLTFEKKVSDGWCVLVPAGTWHNITNIGATPMQ